MRPDCTHFSQKLVAVILANNVRAAAGHGAIRENYWEVTDVGMSIHITLETEE
jgi:hypothetical protein